MRKDWKSCELAEIGHSESFCTAFVVKDWKSCEMRKIGHFVSIRATLMGIPSHSELFWWEKIGKVANCMKLAISSQSEPFWLEKIGKVVNQAKLTIMSHSELLW